MSSSKITKYDMDESVFEDVEKDISDLKSANESLGTDKQDKHSTSTVILPVSSWNSNSQTVTCSGVTADNTVMISPTPDSFEGYCKAQIRCSAQSADSLTFVCGEVPESDVHVNVVILGV